MIRTVKKLILDIVMTDNTFELMETRDGRVWQGKCIHCNSKLYVDDDGKLLHNASIEHIVPTNKGGDENIRNLALACKRCNNEKGIRHDKRVSSRSEEINNNLLNKRIKRWRDKDEIDCSNR